MPNECVAEVFGDAAILYSAAPKPLGWDQRRAQLAPGHQTLFRPTEVISPTSGPTKLVQYHPQPLLDLQAIASRRHQRNRPRRKPAVPAFTM